MKKKEQFTIKRLEKKAQAKKNKSENCKFTIQLPEIEEIPEQAMLPVDQKDSYDFSSSEQEEDSQNSNIAGLIQFFENNFCHICSKAGKLIICDHCPRVYHLKCLNLTQEPTGEYKCDFCKGFIQPSCIRCYKQLTIISNQQNSTPDQRSYAEIMPVKCHSCLGLMHLNCANIPVKMILMGAIYHELLEGDRTLIVNKLKRLQQDKAGIEFGEAIKMKEDLSSLLNKEEHLSYICQVCQESREIDQIFDYYHPNQEVLNVDGDNYDEYFEKCYFLVKFKGVAIVNSIWIKQEYVYHFGKQKYLNFIKRQRDFEESDFEDAYHNIERSQMVPEKVVAHIRKGKFLLMKWKNLDYSKCTWEYQTHVLKTSKHLFDEYKMIQETQKILNSSASERITLMQGRREEMENEPIKYVSKNANNQNKNSDLKLHDYQIEGINWMIKSWQLGNNVILADEMGLGKTIQTIVFISYLMKVQKITRPFLICVPLSTINNWQREFALWCPEARVQVYASIKISREIIRKREFFFKLDNENEIRIPKFNVLLTTYSEILTDFKYLVSIPWKLFLIDEGQRLKNCDSKLFRYAKLFQTEFRVLLSGTPLQNNIYELFNLLEFINPDQFNQEFKDQLQDEYEEFKIGQNENQRNSSEFHQEVNFFQKLSGLLKPYLLRRFKRDVFKDFPKKKEIIVNIEMTKRQRDISRCLIEKNIEELSALEKKKNSAKISLRSLNNILMDLRLVANHSLLLSSLYCTTNFQQKHYQHKQDDEIEINTVDDIVRDSGKMYYLQKMIEQLLVENHKVLIFSQFKVMLNILQDYFKLKQIPILRLDGETENNKRQRLIDIFNDSSSIFKVFLLSTKAGGLGINLTSADTIIIFDSDFNPHNDIQALNRAHRIGQKNNLMIYRFCSKSSVEERILEVAKQKLMLDTLVAQKVRTKEEGSVLYKILKFGTKKLFEKSKESSDEKEEYEVQEDEIQKLLDRETQFKELLEEQEASNENDGVNDYLSGFKVANLENIAVKQKSDLQMQIDQGQRAEESDDEEIFQKLNQEYIQSIAEEENKDIIDQQIQIHIQNKDIIVIGDDDQEEQRPLLQEINPIESRKSSHVTSRVSNEKDDIYLLVENNGTQPKKPRKKFISQFQINFQPNDRTPQQNSNGQFMRQTAPQLRQQTLDEVIDLDSASQGVESQVCEIDEDENKKEKEGGRDQKEPELTFEEIQNILRQECAQFGDLIQNNIIRICHDPNGKYAMFLALHFEHVDYRMSVLSNEHQELIKMFKLDTSLRQEFIDCLELSCHPNIQVLDKYILYWGLDIKNRTAFINILFNFGISYFHHHYIKNQGKSLTISQLYSNSLFSVQHRILSDYYYLFSDYMKFILRRKELINIPQFIFGGKTGSEAAQILHYIDKCSNMLGQFKNFSSQDEIFKILWFYEQGEKGFRQYENISEDVLWSLLTDQRFEDFRRACQQKKYKTLREALDDKKQKLKGNSKNQGLKSLAMYLLKTGQINNDEKSTKKQVIMNKVVTRLREFEKIYNVTNN